MFEYHTASDLDREVVDRTHDYGMTGLALVMAIAALALAIWALTTGVASLGAVADDPTRTAATINSIVSRPDRDSGPDIRGEQWRYGARQ